MSNMSITEYRALAGEPNKKIRNQIQGARNKRNGQQFEDLIEAACEQYFLDKVAKIEKTPEPIKQVGPMQKNGRFIAVYEKAAQVDYKGTLKKGGRTVCFDAKHTESDRIQQSAISSDQEDCLDGYMEMGAVCFVLVSFGFRDFFKVPWGVWKNMKKIYGHKYLKPEEIEQYRVEYRGYLRFLPNM